MGDPLGIVLCGRHGGWAERKHGDQVITVQGRVLDQELEGYVDGRAGTCVCLDVEAGGGSPHRRRDGSENGIDQYRPRGVGGGERFIHSRIPDGFD